MFVSSLRQFVLAAALRAAACGAFLTSLDVAYAFWSLRPRNMVWAELARHAVVSAGIYALFSILASGLGQVLWLALRGTRLGTAKLDRALNGPGWGFGLVSLLWAMAAVDFSWGDDVIRYRLWAYGLLWMCCFLAFGGTAGYCAYRAGQAWQRFRAPRMVLSVGACAVLCCGLALALWPSRSKARAAQHRRPNVVLITVDALRQDALSCYGSKKASTPNIDRLARQGIRFSNANTACPWTRPSCASIHLSVYPGCHGMGELSTNDNPLLANAMPGALSTLAQAFKAKGYATQAFVSNPQVSREFGFDRGFDDYCMYEDVGDRAHGLDLAEAVEPARVAARHAGRMLRFEWVKRSLWPGRCPDGQEANFYTSSGAFLTAAAQRWLRRAPQPFFLWVHYMEVHEYQALELTIAEHTEVSRPDLAALAATTRVGDGDCMSQAMVIDDHALAGEAEQGMSASEAPQSYFHNVEYVDALVGCLLSEFEALGMAKHTHVAFTSDHGEELGERGHLAHGHTQYEEVTRVPFILRGPALGRLDRVIDQPCSLIDLAPTLTDLTRVRKPKSFDGRSLLPAIVGGDMPHMPVCSEFLSIANHERKAVRYGMMKCISAHRGRTDELYDLRADPHETHDLAAERPAHLRRMLDMLSEWQQKQTSLAISVRGRRQPRVKMDVETRDKLKALGYLDTH